MLAGLCLFLAASTHDSDAFKPTPAPTPPAFGFSPVFGDNMVLQQSPAAAAVYGPVSAGATSVTVSVASSDGQTSYSVVAKVGKGATHQPIGYGSTIHSLTHMMCALWILPPGRRCCTQLLRAVITPSQ